MFLTAPDVSVVVLPAGAADHDREFLGSRCADAVAREYLDSEPFADLRPDRMAGDRRRPVPACPEGEAFRQSALLPQRWRGKPRVVMWNRRDTPTRNTALLAEVIDGAWSMIKVNRCVATGVTPLLVLIVTGYAPPLPGDGVPASTAVPGARWLGVNVTAAGSLPLSATAAA